MQSQEKNLEENQENVVSSKSHTVECDADFFGPALPPHLLNKKEETKLCDNVSEKEEKELIGPMFPISEPKGTILIGPEIPDFLKSSYSVPELDKKPTDILNEEDNFGPSINLMSAGDATTFKFINDQNLNKQTSHNDSEQSVKRETWMTELPSKKGANYGLLARHFKPRIQTDKESDDSVWTDTPADKKKKDGQKKIKDHKEILQLKRLKERDKEMEKLVKKAAKKLKKKQSLMEMHAESMKKKKKMESKKLKKEGKIVPERRPFDRNVDLQIRKIDENQKRAILNKSQFLNDRFAPGQSKFL